jgi:hypothetical protein
VSDDFSKSASYAYLKFVSFVEWVYDGNTGHGIFGVGFTTLEATWQQK